MTVLAVIPTYVREPSDVKVLEACLRSLRATTEQDELDVLVVDDGSPPAQLLDQIAELARDLECDLHRKEENSGFSSTVNVGLQQALDTGRDALLVNADVEFIDPGWLAAARDQQRLHGDGLASVVGARLLYPSGLIQHGGIFYSLLERAWGHLYQYGPANLPEALQPRACPVTGALQFIRHECLEGVGLYDEAFQMGFEDVDYCIRVFQAGRECVYQPIVCAYHYESLFRGRASQKVADWEARSWTYFTEKHGRTSFAPFFPPEVLEELLSWRAA